MGVSCLGLSSNSSTPQNSSGGCIVTERIINNLPPNPNPSKFEVLKQEKLEKGMILEVKYHGCTTFNGVKLLLLRCHVDLKYFGRLDPHILGDGHIVCARFEPTEQGWGMARMAAECL